jgi:hypothetical protein
VEAQYRLLRDQASADQRLYLQEKQQLQTQRLLAKQQEAQMQAWALQKQRQQLEAQMRQMRLAAGDGGNDGADGHQDYADDVSHEEDEEDFDSNEEHDDGDDEEFDEDDDDDDDYDDEEEEEVDDDQDDQSQQQPPRRQYGTNVRQPFEDIVRVEVDMNDPRLRFWPKNMHPQAFYVAPADHVRKLPAFLQPPQPRPSAALDDSSSAAAVSGVADDVAAVVDPDLEFALKLDAELNGPNAARAHRLSVSSSSTSSSANAAPVVAVSLSAAISSNNHDVSVSSAVLPPPPPLPDSSSPSATSLPPPPPSNSTVSSAVQSKPILPYNHRPESLISAASYKHIARLLPPPALAAPCYPAMSVPTPPQSPGPSSSSPSSALSSSSSSADDAKNKPQLAQQQGPFSRASLNLLSFDLRIIYEPRRTGYEPTPNFPVEADALIAGRYQILAMLGSAAFSDALECYDIVSQRYVRLSRSAIHLSINVHAATISHLIFGFLTSIPGFRCVSSSSSDTRTSSWAWTRSSCCGF